ncbi:MAG: DUF711 family protein [Anaerolineales bacterium]|nr:DUF711 family protein [Anaerolineales bacterium]
MKIRSITFFLDPGWPLKMGLITQAGAAARQAVTRFTAAGYQVQTTRMATIPFPILFSGLAREEIIAAVQELERSAVGAGFAYSAIGPALISYPESYTLIPEIIAATQTIFCSAEMATKEVGVSMPAVQACAQIITQLAPQDPNGFANLYFTALANVEDGSPFFPAAYHSGGQPGFALAVEAASLAVSAFETADSLEGGLASLRKSVEAHAAALSAVGDQLAAMHDFVFTGIDFSLAPFPSDECSIGHAVELIGVPEVGLHGSLAAAAMLASTLDISDFPRVGFSGLLFPQLEDSVLADRAAHGDLTVKDLLMYSAVCGTGLDTIPLPGDTSPDEIAPLLLDLAALALRLDKPLTARLMPVPGKQAGEPTNFDFPFFANSRVMPISAQGLSSLLRQAGKVDIQARGKSQG